MKKGEKVGGQWETNKDRITKRESGGQKDTRRTEVQKMRKMKQLERDRNENDKKHISKPLPSHVMQRAPNF